MAIGRNAILVLKMNAHTDKAKTFLTQKYHVVFILKFHLFSFQCQFDKNLLQLFIDVVDAELLKTILLEDLKTIDIKNSNIDFLQLLCHSSVHSLKGQKGEKLYQDLPTVSQKKWQVNNQC